MSDKVSEDSGNAIFDELIYNKNLKSETIVKDVQDLEQLESHLDHLERRLKVLEQENQKKDQCIKALERESRSLERKNQSLQKVYIASVQYILSTQRCLSKGRHP